jgi:hypothetical protein
MLGRWQWGQIPSTVTCGLSNSDSRFRYRQPWDDSIRSWVFEGRQPAETSIEGSLTANDIQTGAERVARPSKRRLFCRVSRSRPARRHLAAARSSQCAAAQISHRQKPSSARPTQLTANTHEAIAASDTKVTIVWTDGITEPRCGRDHILSSIFAQSRREFVSIDIEADCGCVATAWAARPQKPTFAPPSENTGWESGACADCR